MPLSDFHGLHLTTEAIAAFGELLLREGAWKDRQLISGDWVRLATGRHIETLQAADSSLDVDSNVGYGYQFWMSRDGYRGDGAFGQLCMVFPEHDLVVAVTAGDGPHGATVGAVQDRPLQSLAVYPRWKITACPGLRSLGRLESCQERRASGIRLSSRERAMRCPTRPA